MLTCLKSATQTIEFERHPAFHVFFFLFFLIFHRFFFLYPFA